MQSPASSPIWLAIRKPLLVTLILACCVSLIASDPFNPRLIASTVIYWSFVPLAEVLGLIAVSWNSRRISLPRSIDLYFAGHGPWLIWFTAISIVWSLVTPRQSSFFLPAYGNPIFTGTAIVVLWSGYIDFRFFRAVMARSRSRAFLDLALQRLLSWALILYTFGWGSLESGLARAQRP